MIVGNLVFLYRSPIEMHNTGRAEAELKADDEGVDKISMFLSSKNKITSRVG